MLLFPTHYLPRLQQRCVLFQQSCRELANLLLCNQDPGDFCWEAAHTSKIRKSVLSLAGLNPDVLQQFWYWRIIRDGITVRTAAEVTISSPDSSLSFFVPNATFCKYAGCEIKSRSGRFVLDLILFCRLAFDPLVCLHQRTLHEIVLDQLSILSSL